MLLVWKPPIFLLENAKFNKSSKNQNSEKKPITLLATKSWPVISHYAKNELTVI